MPNPYQTLGNAPITDDTDYLTEEIQFDIDSNMRTIAIPTEGVVIGVQGDKNVNRVNFRMPAWYNGFDMSTFQPRINFVDPEGNVNYYTVTDMKIYDPDGNEVTDTPTTEDIIYFTWLVDSYATNYVGTVVFNVRFTKFNPTTHALAQAFNTTKAACQVLEGITLADEITQEQQEDLLFHMTAELQDVTDNLKLDIEAKGAETLETIPDDYASLGADVVTLKRDYARLNTGVTDLTSGYTRLNTDVTDLKSGYTHLNTDVTDLTSGYTRLDEDVSDLKNDLIQLETNGYPQASIAEAVDTWANDNIDSFVPDGSITVDKFSDDVQLTYGKDYVTPEMFGAIGDGEEDDTEAMQAAVDYAVQNKKAVRIISNINVTSTITLGNNISIISDGLHTVKCSGGEDGTGMPTFGGVDLKNIIFDNVNIENTGFGTWSDEFGTVGSYVKYGACIALGRCENVTIKNCRLFKAGGYSGEHENIGFCLWLSACKNCIVTENIIECGHHGIVLDRWFANSQWYNTNVTISNNIIHTFSSKGIIYEGSGNSFNISITGNKMYSCLVNFIEGRTWMNLTISNNNMNNSPNYRINPKTAYGFTDSGWDWDTSDDVGIALWCVSGYSENVVVTGNNIEYGSYGLFIPCIYRCIVTANVFNYITENCIQLTGANVSEKPDISNLGDYVITNNILNSGTYGLLFSNSHSSVALNNAIVSDNICIAPTLAKIYNCENITIRGNWGGKPITVEKSNHLEISTTVNNGCDILKECNDVTINNKSYGHYNGLNIRDVTNIRGKLVTDAVANAVAVAYQSVTSGRLEIEYIGDTAPNLWLSNYSDGLYLDIYSTMKPITTHQKTGNTWHNNGETETSIWSAFYNGTWNDQVDVS